MTVSEFIKLWESLNKSNLNIKYYYKDKPMYTYQLLENNNILNSLSITITQDAMNSNDINIYSTCYTDITYIDKQFLNTIKADIPIGSFVYTLNIYLN
jgi:hypothetical protein